jgi:hypothetical protein
MLALYCLIAGSLLYLVWSAKAIASLKNEKRLIEIKRNDDRIGRINAEKVN